MSMRRSVLPADMRPPLQACVIVLAAVLLAACGSAPRVNTGPRAGNLPLASGGRDGAEANPPADLAAVTDAEPRLDAVRNGGANKPYEIGGRGYAPFTDDKRFSERGLASWYGKKFHGRRTASGEVYDMYAMTAAHKTLPIPSYARVRNPANGAEVLVRINDRGPFVAGRIVDLSYTAALKLGVLRGVAPVELERITFDDIRTGAWRRGGAATALAAATPAPPRVAARPLPAAASLPSVSEPAVAAASTAGVVVAAVPPSGEISFTAEPSPLSAGATSATANATAAAAATAATAATATATATATAATAANAATSATAADAGGTAVPSSRGFWVQLGVFRQHDGAHSFRERVAADLDWLAPLLAVFNDETFFRLQAGPYPSRGEALASASRVREALQLVPVIVERR